MLDALTRLSLRGQILWGLAFATVFEAVTALLRFGAGRTSTSDTAFLAAFTFGLRIHHGYVGLLLLALAPFLRPSWVRSALVIIGLGLFLSDLVHHFVVLQFTVGSPQFDLTYPVSGG